MYRPKTDKYSFVPDEIIYAEFKILKVVKKTFLSTVVEALDLRNMREVIVKIEPLSCLSSIEPQIYERLADGEGIPKLISNKVGCWDNIMVLDRLGPSLEELFQRCGRRFSLKTVLMLADQMLERIQYVHDKGIIHRDLTPKNFVIGTGIDANTIHILDFQCGKVYGDKNGSHIQYAENRPPIGCLPFCTTNAHFGIELSRRDDLFALGYIWVYFLKGRLPWQNLKAENRVELAFKVMEKKVDTKFKDLCYGLPKEFIQYFDHCFVLGFEEKPQYTQMRSMFRLLAKNDKISFNYRWDWVLADEKEKKSAAKKARQQSRIESKKPDINEVDAENKK